MSLNANTVACLRALLNDPKGRTDARPHAVAFADLVGFTELGETVPVDELAQVVGADPRNGDGFVTWLTQLKQATGIPRSLSDVGVRMDQIPRLVEIAVADGCHANNPKPVTDEDFRALFVEAITGAIHGGQ